MKYVIAIILLSTFASCTKDKCQQPKIIDFSGNVLYFQPAGNYTIEVVGKTFHGFIKASGTSQRIEGENLKVRIKSDCSDWTEWAPK